MKDINKYQEWTRETAVYKRTNPLCVLMYCALGLAGEAGEAADKTKKLYRDGITDALKEGIIMEIGDAIWYACRLADELEIDMSEVLEKNKNKLEDRMKRNTIKGSGDKR